MQRIKVTVKNIERFGFVREYKADKVKVALFDTSDFIYQGMVAYGHYIKDDWFDLEEVKFL